MKFEIPEWLKNPYVIGAIVVVIAVLYYFCIYKNRSGSAEPVHGDQYYQLPPHHHHHHSNGKSNGKSKGQMSLEPDVKTYENDEDDYNNDKNVNINVNSKRKKPILKYEENVDDEVLDGNDAENAGDAADMELPLEDDLE